MAALEPTQSYPEPRRSSIANLISSRKHHKAKDDTSTDSAPASDAGSDALGISQTTSSDSRIDRIKEKLKGSDGRRLSAKLKGSSTRRQRRNRQQENYDRNGEIDTSLGVASPVDESEGSLSRADSVSSSQLTEDPEPDTRSVNTASNARPPIATHESHAGYLTLSSPLISAETIEPPPDASPVPTRTVVCIDDTLASKKPATLAAPPASRKRGTSPVGKLKDALSSSRKSSKTDLREKSEADQAGKGGSGGGGVIAAGGEKNELGKVAASKSNGRAIQDTQRESDSRPKTPAAINTNVTPSTPPSRESTPTTLVTPPTPTDLKHPTSAQSTPRASSSKGPPSGGLGSRRSRAPSNPSKLSNAISAPPLTPTIEETKTPGGTVGPGVANPASASFFSSVFSATQNAANQLTNSILNPSLIGGQRSRSGTGPDQAQKTGPAGGEEVISSEGVESAELARSDSPLEKKQLAVETLGSGNLSLSHLGITEAPLEPAIKFKKEMAGTPNGTVVRSDGVLATAEDDAAAKAISAAYDRPNGERSMASALAATSRSDRPKSLSGYSDMEPQTPSQPQSIIGDQNVIRRTASIRSRVSERRKRRHRGSSATTGNTIAAAIGAGHAALANPQQSSGPKVTGFAVANPKRNRDFHQLFRSVPEDDYLIEDYSAALQRDILLQGRLYISEGHVCFSSNILGWVTNLVISFDEIVSVEKKTTVVIFPNAIVIQTLHARNVFASLVSRDATYDLLINIWKISHPNLKSSLNGVSLDDGTGDKTEKAGSLAASVSAGEGESDEETDDDVYDEDAEEEDLDASLVEAGAADGQLAGAEAADAEKAVTRKTSGAVVADKLAGGAAKVADTVDAAVTGAVGSADFPGPTTHDPTACGDEGSHYEKPLIDTTIPAPLGKIYSLMFGPASGAFMRKWLIEDQKCGQDLTLEDDKIGMDNAHKTMSFSYIKPLPGGIGPRQTKCIINQTLEQFDLEKAVTINCGTQTPDVPNGNIFVVKTKYCLMWGPGNSTRLVMNCVIEWSGKSWLKGPIEKGANDGQQQYARDIVAALRAAVTARAVPRTPGKAVPGGKKKKLKTQDSAAAEDSIATLSPAPKALEPNWGLFEPLRGPLGPVADVVNMKMVVAVLSFMVLWMWFRTPSPAQPGLGRYGEAQMRLMYEDLWRKEEGELWRWLESRVGGGGGIGEGIWDGVKQSSDGRGAGMTTETPVEEMEQREIEEAIRVTRERLSVLEEVVKRKRVEVKKEL